MEIPIEPQEWIAKARKLHQTFEPGDYGELVELIQLLAHANYFLEAQPSIATSPELQSAKLESNREVLLGLADRIVEDNLPGQRHLWAMIALTYLAQRDKENTAIALGIANASARLDDEPIGWEGVMYAFVMKLNTDLAKWTEICNDYLGRLSERENRHGA